MYTHTTCPPGEDVQADVDLILLPFSHQLVARISSKELLEVFEVVGWWSELSCIWDNKSTNLKTLSFWRHCYCYQKNVSLTYLS